MPAPRPRPERGRWGEDEACRFLAARGCEVLERNYRIRGGEVDIICRENDALCFVEVKCWGRDLWVDLGRSIDARKRGRIRSTARHWLESRRPAFPYQRLRFDVLLVDPDGGGIDWLPGCLDE